MNPKPKKTWRTHYEEQLQTVHDPEADYHVIPLSQQELRIVLDPDRLEAARQQAEYNRRHPLPKFPGGLVNQEIHHLRG